MSSAKSFATMKLTPELKAKRARRDPLAGEGPIVNRARAALLHTAQQFGTVTDTDQTTVTVRTDDGLLLKLSYDGGNFIFSRVYNLRIAVVLPENTLVPANLEISHRGKAGSHFVQKSSGTTTGSASSPASGTSPQVAAVNARVRSSLQRIDLVSGRVTGPKTARELSLVPMGGSYVWVLIPPVFKATAFPPGEPDRIIELLRSLHDWRPSGASAA